MPVSGDDVRKVAALARLRLSDDEVARFATDLDAVVRYVDQLREVDVEGVEPLVHPTAIAPRVRPDEPADVAGRRAVQGSRGYVDGLVRVPKIIE